VVHNRTGGLDPEQTHRPERRAGAPNPVSIDYGSSSGGGSADETRRRRRGHRIRRIAALIAVLLAAGVTGRTVMAQRLPGVPRIGVLAPLSPEQNRESVDAFRTGMHALGWIDGGNVSIEVRFANGDPASSSANAAAFVAAKVDLIVAFSGVSARAARQATSTIPIVVVTDDPIGDGLVPSLPRPGGNVTGLSLMQVELAAKSLQMLKEAAPQVGNVGVLTQSDFPRRAELMKELEPAAASLGVRCCRSTSARPRTCSAVSMR